MKFDSLADKCNYYRSLTDYKLIPGMPVIVMLDGRSFSKFIKKSFNLPFDDRFINIMNFVAEKLCSSISGAKVAYVQSDEISIFLEDYKQINTESFFGYRLTKLLSIIASIATGWFNKELWKIFPESNPIQFDCKAWNVPNLNEVYAWFLYRQNDCIRNSKQQVTQQYYSHKELNGMRVDDQIQKLKDEKGISWWNDFSDNEKYGRLIWKVKERYLDIERGLEYDRGVWKSHPAYELNKSREEFINLIKPEENNDTE